tara:strand:- start:177 stop:494 length:318 start_codon:yes stop_codon:yes gene_type:complete
MVSYPHTPVRILTLFGAPFFPISAFWSDIEGSSKFFQDALSIDPSCFPDAPILEDRLSRKFLHEARASDIHIELMDGELRICYRIDGMSEILNSCRSISRWPITY